jgi:hypothetical protein
MDALVDGLEGATLEASQHETDMVGVEAEVALAVAQVDGEEEEPEWEDGYNGQRAIDIQSQDLSIGCDISGAVITLACVL